MALKERLGRKMKDARERLMDPGERRRLKAEVTARLKKGKETLRALEKKYNTPENRAKVVAKWKEAKTRVARAKKEFLKKERQAVAYTQRNPEKALAVAAAAGALAGALYTVLHRKK